MATCATCSGELRPEWRFCVFCGTAVTPTAVNEAAAEAGARPRLNPIAVIAFIIACVGGIPAIVFGHIALRRIRASGERGRVLAIVATALGYLWLAVGIVLLARWSSGL